MKSSASTSKMPDKLLTVFSIFLLLIYIGIFFYLNMYKYTEHVDSDIAVDAMLAREIWVEKDLTPNNWIASTERLVVGVPAISAVFYAVTNSMVFSMGISCFIVGVLLLGSIGFVLKKCECSNLAITIALLGLCALPINGLRNDGQMVPFVTLLWFLFADYYALHSICLFLCISFYIYLRGYSGNTPSENTAVKITGKLPGIFKNNKLLSVCIWLFLFGLCGGLALGGMRCLQVVIFPLTIWELLLLFFESDHMSKSLPAKRYVATGFIGSLLLVGILAKLYPTNVDYPMYIEDASGMVNRLTRVVPASILECLGIAGNCTLTSFAALMQLGIIALILLLLYGCFYLFLRQGSDKPKLPKAQVLLLQALFVSFLLTVLIETVTNAEPAHNYFFVIWFVIITMLAILITHFGQKAPWFARLIAVCVCVFALCNISYTYKDCMLSTDNLEEYEEVISFMNEAGIDHGYAEFWDASRICIMTDGAITMGHSYHMEHLQMYWWTTSTKWYVPNLPEEMPTAYVVCVEDKDAFEAQFEDPSVVSLGFENKRFAVYVSDRNLVPML